MAQKIRYGLGGHVHVNQKPEAVKPVEKKEVESTKELPLALKEITVKGVSNAEPTSK